MVDVMQWFPEHRKALPVPFEVADRFDQFIKGLTARPIELPFDFEQFQKDLTQADAGSCARLTRQLEDHRGMLLTQAKTRIFRNQIVDCCANALETLREEQFFAELFGRNITLMVGTVNGEISVSKHKNLIKRLNS